MIGFFLRFFFFIFFFMFFFIINFAPFLYLDINLLVPFMLLFQVLIKGFYGVVSVPVTMADDFALLDKGSAYFLAKTLWNSVPYFQHPFFEV